MKPDSPCNRTWQDFTAEHDRILTDTYGLDSGLAQSKTRAADLAGLAAPDQTRQTPRVYKLSGSTTWSSDRIRTQENKG
jgi:hypothetical protein